MKKLIVLLVPLTVLLASTVIPGLAAGLPEAGEIRAGRPKVSPAREAVLGVDVVINVDVLGHRHIRRWQRVIDDVIHVKNDYVRIDVDLDTNEVILHDKQWRDIEFKSVEIKPFEPPEGEYIWKKVVLFVDEEDLGFFDGVPFYTFFDADEYPLVCWEVRYTDGTTVMYDLDGNRIGYGIPAPSSNGYLFSGCHLFLGVCWNVWSDWRDNANYWYSKWTNSTTSVFHPTTAQIRSYVSNPNTKFYYAIAHGGYRACWYEKKDGWVQYYNSTLAYQDMANRDPMHFAFLGHCDAMVNTTDPSFSDAFRKGRSEWGSGTVTVGYSKMKESTTGAWSVSRQWQNRTFAYMDAGRTIYDAYLRATYLHYPQMVNATGHTFVKFVGDPGLRVVGPSGVKGYVGLHIPGWGAFPFAGAKVAVHETGEYVFTNSHGYYEILLPPGSYTLTASYPTFYDTTQTAAVFPATFTERHFVLEPMYPGKPIPVVVPGDGLV